VIDPTTIKPECRYSTGEAAKILDLTPGWFKKLAAKKQIKPVNPGGVPLYWVGIDLWKFVDYRPTFLPPSVVKKTQKEALEFARNFVRRSAQRAREKRATQKREPSAA